MGKIGSTIELQGEAQFKSAVQGCTSALKLMQSEMKNVEQSTSGSANSLETLSKKHDILSRTLDKQKEKYNAISQVVESQKQKFNTVASSLEKYKEELSEAQQKLEQMKSSGEATEQEIAEQEEKVSKLSDAVQRGTRSYQNHEKSLTDWQKKLVDAETDIESTNQQLLKNESYMQEASSAADNCATSIDQFGNATKNLSENLAETVVQVSKLEVLKEVSEAVFDMIDLLSGVSNDVFDFGSAFDSSMSNVKAISGATGETFQALSDKAHQMGETTQFSASEAADAMNYMAVAGWTSQQMIDGIDGVLMLAAAGGLELGSAADIVAGNLAAFNMQADEAGRLSDIMATAQGRSKTTASQLAEAYSTSATNMTQYGQSVETTTAMLEAMASVNDTGSAAGTKLNAVVSQMIAKMEDGAIAIGDTAVAVQDSSGNMRDMVDIIADIEAATTGMGDAEKAAALQTTFNRTSLSGLNEILSVGSDQLRTYRGELENSTGAAEEMANTMNDNFAGDVKLMQSAWEGLADTIWESTNGKARTGVQAITEVLGKMNDAMKDAPGPVKDFVGSLTVAVQAGSKVAPTLQQVANLTLSVKQAKSLATLAAQANTAATATETAATTAQATATTAAAGAQGLLNTALLASPVGVVAAAIVALVGGLALLDNALGDVTGQYGGLNDSLNNSINATRESRDALVEAGDAMATAFDNASNSIASIEAQSSVADTLISRMEELQGQSVLTNAEQAEMASIAQQLTAIYPELSLSIDETTGKINESAESVRQYVAELQKSALAKGYMEAIEEASKALADAQIEQAKTQQQLKNLNSESEAAEAAYTAALEEAEAATRAKTAAEEELNAVQMNSKATAEDMQAAQLKLNEATGKADAYVRSAEDAYDAYSTAQANASDEVKKTSEALEEHEKAVENAQNELELIIGSAEDAGISMSEMAAAQDGAVESTENLADAQGELGDTLSETSDEAVSAAQAMQEAYNEAFTAIMNDLNSSSGLFQQYAADANISLQSMNEALASQTEAFTNYTTNMNTVMSDTRYATDENFRAMADSIMNMGIDGADYLQQFVNAASGSGEEMATLLSNFGDAQAAKENFAASMAEFQTAAEEGVEGAAQAFESGEAKVTAATEQMTEGAKQSMEQSAEEAGTQGESAGTQYAQGIQGQASTASSAASTVANGAVNEFIAYSSQANTWGVHMGSQFAAGLASQASAASSAAMSVAAAAAASLHHTTPDEGPLAGDDKWGFEMSSQFAKGIADGAGLTREASKYVAKAAAEPIQELKDEKAKLATDLVNYSEIIKEVNESEAKSFETLYEAAIKTTKQTSSLFKEITDSDKVSYDSMTGGLESQYRAYSTFADNLNKLTTDTRYTTDENFKAIVDSIADMGISGQQYLKIFSDAASKGGSSLEKVIGDWKGLETAKDRYATAIAKIQEANQDLSTSTEVDAKKLKAAWGTLTDDMAADMDKLFATVDESYEGVTGKISSINSKTMKSSGIITVTLKDEELTWEAYQNTVTKVTSDIRYKNDKAFKSMADTIIDMGMKGGKALRSFSKIADQSGDNLEDLLKKFQSVNGKYSADLQKIKQITEQVAEQLKEEWQEVYDAAYKSVNGQNDLFKQYQYNEDQTLDSMIESLNSQQIAMEAYATNVNYILSSSRYNTDAQFQAMADNIMSMGMDGATYLDQFAQAARDGGKGLEDLISAYQGANQAKDDYAKAMADMETGLSGGTLELATSISSQKEEVERAAASIAEAAALKFRELVEKADDAGKDTGEKLGDGLDDSDSTVGNAAARLSDTTGRNIQYTHAYADGVSIGENMAAGMRSQAAAVAAAAEELAEAAAGYLHHSTPDKGPLKGDDKWGAELSENFAIGIREGIQDAEDAAEELAEYTANALNTEISPSVGMLTKASRGSTAQSQTRTVIENRFYLGDRDVTKLITDKVVKQITQQMKNQTVARGGY